MWRFRVLFWLSDKWTVICRFFKRKIKYLSPLFYWLSCDATLFRSYSCAFHNNLKPQEVNPCLKIGFRCASPSSRFIYFFWHRFPVLKCDSPCIYIQRSVVLHRREPALFLSPHPFPGFHARLFHLFLLFFPRTSLRYISRDFRTFGLS